MEHHDYINGGFSIMSELRTNRIIPRDGLPSGSSGGIIQVKSVTKTDLHLTPSNKSQY